MASPYNFIIIKLLKDDDSCGNLLKQRIIFFKRSHLLFKQKKKKKTFFGEKNFDVDRMRLKKKSLLSRRGSLNINKNFLLRETGEPTLTSVLSHEENLFLLK